MYHELVLYHVEEALFAVDNCPGRTYYRRELGTWNPIVLTKTRKKVPKHRKTERQDPDQEEEV